MINIVSFSGGKDSTALLLMMIEKGWIDINTKKGCKNGRKKRN